MRNVRLVQHDGYIFLMHMAMSPSQIETIQDSFEAIARQSREASRLFYDELFTLAPSLQHLFSDDLAEQKKKFIQMLSTIVNSLHQVTRMSEHIADLGRRHMAYDVEDEHYAMVGQAFLAMLNRLLGPDLTPEIREAWAAAFDMLARVMQDASAGSYSARNFFASIIRSVLASQYGAFIVEQSHVNGRAQITHSVERGEVVQLPIGSIVRSESV